MALTPEQHAALVAAQIDVTGFAIAANADSAAPPPAPAATAPTVTAPLPAASAPSAPADGGVAALLAAVQADSVKHQVRAANLEAALAALTDKHTLMAAEHGKLATIVRCVVGKLTIPLGGSQASVDILAVSDLLAKYPETLAAYEKAFPIGGVAQPAGTADGQGTAAKVNPLFLHVLEANSKP